MSKKEVKTNAMRMLDRMKIPYEYEEYECDDFTDGIQTADKLGYDHKLVYKTLVTTGKTGNHYVFVIPIEAEIDFKKAAKVVGEKSLEMLHLKDLTKVTGYVSVFMTRMRNIPIWRSPIPAMKKMQKSWNICMSAAESLECRSGLHR